MDLFTHSRRALARAVCPIALGLACVAPPAFAADAVGSSADTEPAGPNTLYFGISQLTSHSRLADLAGFNTPPALNLNVGNATTAGFGFVRRLRPHWSAELALGAPPRVRTDAMGAGWSRLGIQPGTGVTDVHIVSPTAFLNYHFGGEGTRWDPFVGVGINYTRFTDTTALPALNGHLGPTRISLSDSWGAAAHAGLVYRWDARWSLTAALAIADVHSNLTSTSVSPLNSTLITSQGSTRIDFRPVVYTLGLGYSF